MHRRLSYSVTVSAVVLAGVVAACTAGTSDGVDDGSRQTPYYQSDCGICVKAACADVFRECDATKDCRAYLDCLESCPVDKATGDVEAACVAKCPVADRPETILATRRVAQCRTEGVGLACTSCGTSVDAGGGADAIATLADADANANADAPSPTSDADAARPKNPIVDQVCAPSTASETCQSCEETSCCDTRAACVASADCQAVSSCASACATDPAPDTCEAVCFENAPAPAVALHLARFTCLQLYCADPTACGTAPVPACTACALSHCQNEFANCYGDRACRKVAACANKCNAEATCVDTCLAGAPDAVRQAFVDYNVCGQLSCPAECPM